MRQRITRRPLFAFAVGFLAVLLGGTLLQAALHTLFPTLTKEWLAVATMAGRGLVALALVAWFGWREEVGLTPPRRWRNVHLAWLLLPLPLIALLDGVRADDPSRIAFLALAALFVAVNEELFFRGLLLRALQPWGDPAAVAVLAALFSVAHLANLAVGGDPRTELLRLPITLGGAIGLAAIRLRTNTLWFVIAAHWALDLAEYLASNGIPALGAELHYRPATLGLFVGYNAFLAVVGVYLLRRGRRGAPPLAPHSAVRAEEPATLGL